MVDPRTQMPMVSWLRGSPTFIHFFNPGSSQAIEGLEVAHFNRISQKCEIDNDLTIKKHSHNNQLGVWIWRKACQDCEW